jgi:hypothetical protein
MVAKKVIGAKLLAINTSKPLALLSVTNSSAQSKTPSAVA